MFFYKNRISFLIFKVLFIIILATFLTIPVVGEQPEFDLSARSAILMEAETGSILYKKNSNLKLPPASMTKMMTMLLVMEAIENNKANLSDKIIISEYAAEMGGSQIWLEPGEEMTLKELMKAIAIVSANDACVAVAEYLYGTADDFVDRMNEKAQELGLKNTYYYNTNGLPPDDSKIKGNYTSAKDLAILAQQLLQYPKILDWTSTWIDYLRDGDSVLNNTNWLVRHYQGADGIKTGYTDEAKFCVTSTAQRNGLRFIAVIMAGESSQKRFQEAAQLLSYGFNTYENFNIANKDEIIKNIKINNAKIPELGIIISDKLSIPIPKGKEDEITKKITINDKIKAPLSIGDKVGEIEIFKGNLLIKTQDLVAARDVEKVSIWKMMFRFIKQLLQSLLNIFS